MKDSRPSVPPELLTAPGAAVPSADLPHVTVVILNLNGRAHLELCFESLRAMDYPAERLDVLLIDNGSDDGSVDEVRSRWPWVRVVVNARNVGFASGCNQGATLRGNSTVLAFLNNDMRVDRGWLRALVQPIVRGECVATTSRMLSWDGTLIDSAGGGMNFHGMGLQYGYGDVPGASYDAPRRTLFPCGGAMAIDAAVFDDAGGFDDEFFAYYEDVDLGWRLWVQGHEVHYVPDSTCWHHHHGTSRHLPQEAIRLIQVRNPLLACFKNYDDENLRRVLPVALALFLRRMVIISGIASDAPYRIQFAAPPVRRGGSGWLRRLLARMRGLGTLDHGRATVSGMCVADLIGANDLLGNWDHWMRRRAVVQQRRRRTDQDIFSLFLDPLWCIEQDPQYQELFKGSTAFFGIRDIFAASLSAPPTEPAPGTRGPGH
jgi:GT2 family glycosyltransferase